MVCSASVRLPGVSWHAMAGDTQQHLQTLGTVHPCCSMRIMHHWWHPFITPSVWSSSEQHLVLEGHVADLT